MYRLEFLINTCTSHTLIKYLHFFIDLYRANAHFQKDLLHCCQRHSKAGETQPPLLLCVFGEEVSKRRREGKRGGGREYGFERMVTGGREGGKEGKSGKDLLFKNVNEKLYKRYRDCRKSRKTRL